jgi:hypothetical protein
MSTASIEIAKVTLGGAQERTSVRTAKGLSDVWDPKTVPRHLLEESVGTNG